jgi:hypothetical protein
MQGTLVHFRITRITNISAARHSRFSRRETGNLISTATSPSSLFLHKQEIFISKKNQKPT